MKHIIGISAVLGCTLGTALVGLAGCGGQFGPGMQGGPQGGPGGGLGEPPMPSIIAIIDANHNRSLEADELAGAGAALLALDANGDGVLQAEELAPAPRGGERGRPDGPPPGRKPPRDLAPCAKEGGSPVMAALDADHDGTLSAAEMGQAGEHLKQLDINGDGVLSAEELQAPRPKN